MPRKPPQASDEQDEQIFGILASCGFAAMCAIAIVVVQRYGSTDIEAYGFFDLSVLGLACLRLIHLISYDMILSPLRELLRKSQGVWSRLTADFVGCIWCTGMWSALLSVTLYLLGGWARIAVFLLAVAALGSLLQVISKAIAGIRA